MLPHHIRVHGEVIAKAGLVEEEAADTRDQLDAFKVHSGYPSGKITCRVMLALQMRGATFAPSETVPKHHRMKSERPS